jgi:hypothetical protein
MEAVADLKEVNVREKGPCTHTLHHKRKFNENAISLK